MAKGGEDEKAIHFTQEKEFVPLKDSAHCVQGDFSQLLDKKMTDFSEKLIDFEFESIPV